MIGITLACSGFRAVFSINGSTFLAALANVSTGTAVFGTGQRIDADFAAFEFIFTANHFAFTVGANVFITAGIEAGTAVIDIFMEILACAEAHGLPRRTVGSFYFFDAGAVVADQTIVADMAAFTAVIVFGRGIDAHAPAERLVDCFCFTGNRGINTLASRTNLSCFAGAATVTAIGMVGLSIDAFLAAGRQIIGADKRAGAFDAGEAFFTDIAALAAVVHVTLKIKAGTPAGRFGNAVFVIPGACAGKFFFSGNGRRNFTGVFLDGNLFASIVDFGNRDDSAHFFRTTFIAAFTAVEVIGGGINALFITDDLALSAAQRASAFGTDFTVITDDVAAAAVIAVDHHIDACTPAGFLTIIAGQGILNAGAIFANLIGITGDTAAAAVFDIGLEIETRAVTAAGCAFGAAGGTAAGFGFETAHPRTAALFSCFTGEFTDDIGFTAVCGIAITVIIASLAFAGTSIAVHIIAAGNVAGTTVFDIGIGIDAQGIVNKRQSVRTADNTRTGLAGFARTAFGITVTTVHGITAETHTLAGTE